MKVYILTAEYCDSNFIEGVFSSYSAMLTYLWNTYSFESEVFKVEGGGDFKDTCSLGCGIVEWKLSYEVLDLIGEHSPHNGCLKCKGG